MRSDLLGFVAVDIFGVEFTSFDQIMEDEALRTWRRQLLEGRELPQECRTCHWAPPGAPAQLSALVERLRAPNLAGRDRFGITAAGVK